VLGAFKAAAEATGTSNVNRLTCVPVTAATVTAVVANASVAAADLQEIDVTDDHDAVLQLADASRVEEE
jgi:hypothetical protein